MKESVKTPKNPWPPALCAVAIGGVFFYLLAHSAPDPPRKGSNTNLDVSDIINADRIETNFEETGSIVPGLEKPSALAIAPNGNIYIAGKDAVEIFGSDGEALSRFEMDGTAKCINIAQDGTTFIGLRDHVEVFDVDGELLAKWESLGPDTYITSIAADAENVFVADMGHRIVHRYGRNGELLGQIGKKDLNNDVLGLVVPSPHAFDVAFDDEGTLWVVNSGRMGLEAYRSDGVLITSWYKPSFKLEGFSGCCNPSHIAFDSAGRLITADKGLVRLKIYDVTSGEFKELIAGTKDFPTPQPLKDIAVDARDRILVLDPREDTVRIFEQKGGDRV